MNSQAFQCSCCGEMLDGPAMAWHFDAPEQWLALSEEDREQLGELTSDQCVIEREHFFVRGIIEIPVLDGAEEFSWGVWVSLSAKNYDRAGELWNDPGRVNEPPYFGWLCNSIPGYPDTLFLKTNVHTREVGVRPYIELQPSDHPLSIEQRDGITMAAVRAFAERMHHQ